MLVWARLCVLNALLREYVLFDSKFRVKEMHARVKKRKIQPFFILIGWCRTIHACVSDCVLLCADGDFIRQATMRTRTIHAAPQAHDVAFRC